MPTKEKTVFPSGHDLSFVPSTSCDDADFPAWGFSKGRNPITPWPISRRPGKVCDGWAADFRQTKAQKVNAPTVGPSLFLDPSATLLLTGDFTVLARFIHFLSHDVVHWNIPASKIEIRGSVDPEDDTSQIIVRLWIRELSNGEIRDYYSAFGSRVDAWMKHLPEEQRGYLVSKISFQARREADV